MDNDIYTPKGIFRSLVVLAIPIICQNLITYGVTLADNLMIGRLGKDGMNQTDDMILDIMTHKK